MQLQLPFERRGPTLPRFDQELLEVGGRRLPLMLVPHRRARRYILRLHRRSFVRVTIPRGGSQVEARRFAHRNIAWLERQLLRQSAEEPKAAAWGLGTEVLFRGQKVRLELESNGAGSLVRLGSELVRVKDVAADLRSEIQRHLWRLAVRELPPRVLELAGQHQVPVHRVFVRNQRSRWGSRSRRGTVSLNWRLVQAPATVRDYIILHELMHFRHMNHSRRFWREVASVCPGFGQSERWLKEHSALLR